MASIGIIFDDARLLQDLQSITKKVEDLTVPMKLTGEYITNQTRDRFDSQTAPNGTPWKALSDNYQARKRRNQDKVLTLSTQLRRSIHYRAARREVVVGTDRIYGAIHQLGFDGVVSIRAFRRKNRGNDVYAKFGGKRRKIASGVGFVKAHTRHMRIDARPYIGLSNQDFNEIPRIFTRWMEKR